MDLTILPARSGTRVALRKGQMLKVVNTHGGQVVDLWAFLPDGSQHMSMPHSVVTLGRIKPLPGDLLYTQLRQPILRLEADESPGTHCMLFAACDAARYALLGAKGYHHNCADNMRQALKPLGIDAGYVPTPLNLFMNTLFHDHREMEVAEPRARPGDSVTFRAEQDCIAVMSACPQDMVPVNAHGCTPQPVGYCIL
ncbi:DUF1989 domain-containing protein [Bordetella genomosp. 11]|uniref:DUF1989 domain-containing protein n=1 Tax=Bordetella genomosp. 11 TaxID=1416808 RepID=A0A261UCS3_9BORD|nr:urea carboxylase-associated family protein [Bordetella genomosp. 11]OZI59726.1 hypothetical protein CAL28_09455 [Bordetella genomosp. 11]